MQKRSAVEIGWELAGLCPVWPSILVGIGSLCV